MRYLYLLLMSLFLTVSFSLAEDLYSREGYFVISTFEVLKMPASGQWLIRFPKDQGQPGLAGVDTIAVFVGVDKDGYGEDYRKTTRSKLHQSDLKPMIAVLDPTGRWYECKLDRNRAPDKFRGIFWGRVMATGEWTWHNVDPSLSIVPTDPHGVRVGEYWGYFWDFPAVADEKMDDLSFDVNP